MRIGKLAGIACAALLWCAAARAEISISASADRAQVSLAESVRVSVTVTGGANMPSPQLPDLSAFAVYSSGRSQNISFVNGQVSSSITHTYLLTPKAAGKFTIGPFSVTAEGQTVQTQPIPIEVLPAGQAPPAAAQQRATSRSAGAFVKLSASPTRALVNEEIILTFRFYYRIALLANPAYQPPDTTGFVTEDLPPPRTFSESVNGLPYQVTEIKTAIFPTRPGALTIAPAALKIQVEDLSHDPFSEDFFNQFFGRAAKEYVLRSEPVTIHVQPLPAEGKPSDFSGGVGEFRISAAVDKKKPSAGEPVTLTVTLQGSGNIKTLGDPEFPAFQGFRKYDTASSLNIDKMRGRVEGSKVYQIVLVPQNSGAQAIPEIAFSYFHLPSKSYRTVRTEPIRLDVQPAKPGTAPAVIAGTPAAVENVAEDIRYIKTSWQEDAGRPFHRSPAFPIAAGAPLLLLAGSAALRGRQAWIERNPEKRRQSRAAAEFFRQARISRALLTKSQEQALATLFAALQKFFADKMLLEGSAVSLRAAEEFLRGRGTTDSTISELRRLWNEIELARFAPAGSRGVDTEKLIERAEAAVKDIDKTASGGALRAWALIACGAGLAAFAQAQDPQAHFDLGNAAYQQGHFDAAYEHYRALADSLPAPSFVLEYNLGNAAYRLGRSGEAIARWLGALNLRPRDGDVRHNLKLVSARVGDPVAPESFAARALAAPVFALTTGEWSVLLAIALWIFCAAWALALIRRRPLLAPARIWSAVALLIIGAAWLARWNDALREAAVISVQKAEARSGPGMQFGVGFTVPEGRRVQILQRDPSGDWLEIGVRKEGARGWIPSSALTRVRVR